MGVVSNTGGNTLFLNVVYGKLRKKATPADEGKPDVEKRVNKEGDEVWEFVHGGYIGDLIGIEARDRERYGIEIQLTMKDGDEVAKIGMPFKSDYFMDFANRLLSLTPEDIASNKLEINPFSYTKDGYTDNYLGVRFPGEENPRKRKYTKDSPGEMPQWEKTKDEDGKDKWSSLKQRKWLAEQVKSLIEAANDLRDQGMQSTPAKPSENIPDGREEFKPESIGDDEEDDLPF